MQTSSSTYVIINNGNTGHTGYGIDFNWGTFRSRSEQPPRRKPPPYMNYNDNPMRPLLGFWFGPMTMIDFLGNYNLWYTGTAPYCSHFCWWPGTCHESPAVRLQAGHPGGPERHASTIIPTILSR